ncbi:MAG: flagellar protein FlgN, partial [Desulfovibrionales bacterium]|nr:flagellar protein FlgN [Desulfovibrionales bacterium]
MEDRVQVIEGMIRQKLELYRQLNTIMEKERDYIVDMDVDSLWKSSEEKKKISRRITFLRG